MFSEESNSHRLLAIVSWIFLGLQAAIVVASLLGYGLFTARPDLLMQVDPQARFFTWAFHGFAVGNMLFGGVAVAAEALIRNRRRAFAAFLVVYAVSLTSELCGTTYGIPFGAYGYTDLLGPKWFDKVPLLIPLSWFTMSWAVWLIARRWVNGLSAVLLGSALLVAWDLLLDPAMSHVTSYWVWGEAGSYYGMPLMNLAGWAMTGFLLLALINKIAPTPQGSLAFAAAVYLVNFLLPLGFCVLNQYWVPVVCATGTAAFAWILAAGIWRPARAGHPSREAVAGTNS